MSVCIVEMSGPSCVTATVKGIYSRGKRGLCPWANLLKAAGLCLSYTSQPSAVSCLELKIPRWTPKIPGQGHPSPERINPQNPLPVSVGRGYRASYLPRCCISTPEAQLKPGKVWLAHVQNLNPPGQKKQRTSQQHEHTAGPVVLTPQKAHSWTQHLTLKVSSKGPCS